MSMTEDRMQVEAPVERTRGARWWIVAVIGVVALACGALIGTVIDGSDKGSSEVASTVFDAEPGDHAVDFAQRWGDALESGDNEALRALYRSQDDGGATIIDHMYRAVWTDADSATDRIIDNPMEFERVDLVGVEESGQVFVAEYEMDVILPGEGPDHDPRYVPDRVTFVVVFHDLAEGRVGQSDIYFPFLSSFVTGEIGGYPQRAGENETGPRPTDWIIIE
jgi:hypothetical protein